jgi:hypothetical protein
MGRHSIPGPDDFSDEPSEHDPEQDPGVGARDAGSPPEHPATPDDPDQDRPASPSGRLPSPRGRRGIGEWRGGHRSEGGQRGVSLGVIAALVAVVVVVSTVILWRFFGHNLSHRSDAAAGRCVEGDDTVAVVADPSIADHIREFAERYNASAKPVGDRCVSVSVTPAGSDAVVGGFIGQWPADLGARPALWIPASSISTARLQAAAGRDTVSDSRSLVSSPVLLAMRPELRPALEKQSWATLPELQTRPDSLARLQLPGWGSLRLALPTTGNGDAPLLAAETVAVASAPHGAPVTDGAGAVRTLMHAQPDLTDDSVTEAMNTLLRPGDRAGAPVHAVVTTEQQVFTRGQSLSDAGDALSSWLPPGPAAVADYPTVSFNGSWLSREQVSGANEFARFTRKADQLSDLAKDGFRVEGVAPPHSDVTDFPSLPSTLSIGDDELRAAISSDLGTGTTGSTVTLMLDESMTTGGLTDVSAALSDRIQALAGDSTVGLWTFDGTEGRPVVTTGPLGDDVDGRPRTAALTSALHDLRSTSDGAVSFTTLPMVYKNALANYTEGQRNSILVITAGRHTDRTLDGPGLQEFLRGAADPQHPVAVDIIDFGDADRDTWEAVAHLSGGSYANLPGPDSPEFAKALGTLLG